MGIKNRIHKLESKNPRGGYERGVDDGLNDAANLVAKEADELMQEMADTIEILRECCTDMGADGEAAHTLHLYKQYKEG